MNLRPLDDRVVIKALEAETKTKGGIVLPDTAKEKPQKGEVIAVGEGKLLDNGKRVTPILKKGDKVLFGRYAGTEIKIDGTEFTIMKESEVLARFEG
ncbi:MAG: co-chaperone GroES [Planctomycetes bacterium]|nr:co-chaperone GroES [Planctomycetota bacterium]